MLQRCLHSDTISWLHSQQLLHHVLGIVGNTVPVIIAEVVAALSNLLLESEAFDFVRKWRITGQPEIRMRRDTKYGQQ